MDTINLIVDVFLIITIIAYILTVRSTKNYFKKKIKVVDNRIELLNKLYEPTLKIIMIYYAEKEEYEKAKYCKDLLEILNTTNSTTN